MGPKTQAVGNFDEGFTKMEFYLERIFQEYWKG